MTDQIAGFSTGATGSDIVVEKVAAIPNSMYEIPKVSIKQCRVLAFMEDSDGLEAWYEIRSSGRRAAIRPYSDRERVIAAECGKIIEEDTYTRETSFSKIPAGAETIRMVRNPWLPIPTGCKLAEDELTLVKA